MTEHTLQKNLFVALCRIIRSYLGTPERVSWNDQSTRECLIAEWSDRLIGGGTGGTLTATLFVGVNGVVLQTVDTTCQIGLWSSSYHDFNSAEFESELKQYTSGKVTPDPSQDEELERLLAQLNQDKRK